MSLRDTWQSWLGPAADTITDDQLHQLDTASRTISARWPDPDLADTREHSLAAAAQVILGDATLESVSAEWHAAVRAVDARRAALAGAVIATPGSEQQRAERAGITRQTVRKRLGKDVKPQDRG